MAESIRNELELNQDFLLFARTDVNGAHNDGIKEAIRRGNVYAKARTKIFMNETR